MRYIRHRKAPFFVSLFIITLFVSGVGPSKVEAASYLYNFDTSGVVAETGSLSESSSSHWWVNSGGYLKIEDTKGFTITGSLPTTDPWRVLYAANNPTDTDNGYHPQNIFRLVSKNKWQNFRQEAYFVIKKDNVSKSSNRNQSNGLLLFNRYQDGMNLYYTGVRVDGSAIIKKKKNGTYYTLAEVKGVYPGTYDRTKSPDLLPKDKWIGLRSELINLPNGAVEIRLYIDKGWQGKWELVAKATDDGKTYGGAAFTQEGYGGIRTDFMDVEFENYRAKDITSFTPTS